MRAGPFALILILSACQYAGPAGVSQHSAASRPLPLHLAPPERNGQNTCWEAIESQASEEASPAGASGQDPRTRQGRAATTPPRLGFDALCPQDLTPVLLASLQRALTVRGHYWGPITGALDTQTEEAVRSFQRPLGIDSPRLSRAAAERLGLVVTPVPASETQKSAAEAPFATQSGPDFVY